MDERLTISASRVGPMLGASKFGTPLSLYLQLRGEMPEMEDNELLKEGRYFEDAIARIAAEKYGFQVDLEAPKELLDGPLSGHPDRWFIQDGHYGVLEIKNTMFGHVGEGGWGDPGTDQVPQTYWLQAQVYCHLAIANAAQFGYPMANYCLLAARLRSGVELYKVHYDAKVIERIKEEAVAFLARVRDGIPPDPIDEQDQRNRWLVEEGKAAQCDVGFLAHLRALQALKADKKSIEQKISDLQTIILGFARDAERIDYVDADGAARTVATLGANRKFDEAACLRDHPDLLKHYAKLDTTKLGKEQKALYERYMRRPENAVEQTRTIRIREKELGL